MTLLERYIFRRAIGYTLGSLAALVAVVWIVQVLSRIDFVRTSASAAGNLFWIALMLMPDLAAGVIPFAILIGAVQALNGLNADSERAVIDAAGAPRISIANPILLLGVLGGLLVFVNSQVVGPKASAAFQNGIRTINADAISLFLTPGSFEELQAGVVVSVEDARGRHIDGLFMADTREPQYELTYFAKQGQIIEQFGSTFLVMQDGQLHRRITATGEVSIVEFQTNAVDLSTLRPVSANDWVRMSERSTAELLRPNPSDSMAQQRPERYVEEIAARRTDWLYPIAFAFWAVVVAGHARTNRQGAGPTMLIALGGALVLRALGFVSLSLVETNIRFVALVYAMPVLSFAISAALYATQYNIIEMPLVRRIAGVFADLAEALRRRAAGPRSALERGQA